MSETTEPDGSFRRVWLLTLAHRIVNLTQVEDELSRLQGFIKTVQTMDHMEDSARQQVLELAEERFYPEEARILELLESGMRTRQIRDALAPSTSLPSSELYELIESLKR